MGNSASNANDFYYDEAQIEAAEEAGADYFLPSPSPTHAGHARSKSLDSLYEHDQEPSPSTIKFDLLDPRSPYSTRTPLNKNCTPMKTPPSVSPAIKQQQQPDAAPHNEADNFELEHCMIIAGNGLRKRRVAATASPIQQLMQQQKEELAEQAPAVAPETHTTPQKTQCEPVAVEQAPTTPVTGTIVEVSSNTTVPAVPITSSKTPIASTTPLRLVNSNVMFQSPLTSTPSKLQHQHLLALSLQSPKAGLTPQKQHFAISGSKKIASAKKVAVWSDSKENNENCENQMAAVQQKATPSKKRLMRMSSNNGLLLAHNVAAITTTPTKTIVSSFR